MNYGGIFDVSSKEKRLVDIKALLQDKSVWSDNNKLKKLSIEQRNLEEIIDKISTLKNKITENIKTLNDVSEDDVEIIDLIRDEEKEIKTSLEKLEIEVLLNKEYDNCNCIFEIHSGAGGTESCDWAMMLFRMYRRYFERKGYSYEIVDYQDGEEAGIKSVSMIVKGFNCYGYLKCEKGVHRLVRLSPFDANNKRHTSFASVDVTPEIIENNDITIKDDEIKIDVYRSTGAGGQGVNTTDSAVRITYLPLKIVVTCQNERSQIQNKEHAMQILKSKLLMTKKEEEERRLSKIKGKSMDIAFGSQIRSYVMHPYSLVKDHRTSIETSNISKVMDGDIDMFIEGYLRSVKDHE